ncbi:MAG: hypothetical protein KDC54_19770, partial [Lewinella sp.]|nr:hypothetical protein [Lewinella sp.]
MNRRNLQFTGIYLQWLALLLVLFTGIGGPLWGHVVTTNEEVVAPADEAPLLFMENAGQVTNSDGVVRADILFLARQGGVKVAIKANGLSYQFEKHKALESPFSDEATVTIYRLDLELLNANPTPVVERTKPHPYFENYYNIASAPEGILGVRAYEQITLREVYPGIDWVIYTRDGQMKYDFVVQPGADPAQIRLRYSGSTDLQLNADGSVMAQT